MKGEFIKNCDFIVQDSKGKVLELGFNKGEQVEIKMDVPHDKTWFTTDGEQFLVINTTGKNIIGVNRITLKNWIKIIE